MRLKRSRVKTCHIRKRISMKDAEGAQYDAWSDPKELKGEFWPAGGRVQAEIYGTRLPYIRNFRVDGKYQIITGEDGKTIYRLESGTELMEMDGVCLFVYPHSSPDYRIVAIRPYRFLILELEAI